MSLDDEMEKMRAEILDLQKSQQTLMDGLTSFADSVKRTLVSALDGQAELGRGLGDIRAILADLRARVEDLEKSR